MGLEATTISGVRGVWIATCSMVLGCPGSGPFHFASRFHHRLDNAIRSCLLKLLTESG